ncbi:uncharacterized protein LOC129228323 [Uloborus diversus]|uniref:uncharacterized protein LOC129228323 n=1 Tax=Uloborus diversus TaxID=327109 RepID=UPI002409DDD4|nr:uncharacterized protein LOC129228323 [Uloborus diversus]
MWIKTVQWEVFREEIQRLQKNQQISKSSKIYSLSPYLDETGVLRPITYGKFMSDANITAQDHARLSIGLEEYLNCTIEFNGVTTRCNMENVLGSFYTMEELPQYCYTIYSLWGNPNGKREKIPKGAIMKLNFFLNVSLRVETRNPVLKPSHNIPSSPNVQIAVHSPYFLPSPYLEGKNFLGGSAYEVRVTLDERHLLPLPYQTNCTDYLKTWQQRGGRAPINQLGVIQECRLNRTYDVLKCIPVTLDYPHTYNICPACSKSNCAQQASYTKVLITEAGGESSKISASYATTDRARRSSVRDIVKACKDQWNGYDFATLHWDS